MDDETAVMLARSISKLDRNLCRIEHNLIDLLKILVAAATSIDSEGMAEATKGSKDGS